MHFDRNSLFRVRGKISHGDVSMRTVIDRDDVFVSILRDRMDSRLEGKKKKKKAEENLEIGYQRILFDSLVYSQIDRFNIMGKIFRVKYYKCVDDNF